MFDQGFGPEVMRILGPLKRKANPASVVLVSATMSKAVRKLAAEQLPGLVTLETSTLHKGVVGASRPPAPPPAPRRRTPTRSVPSACTATA